MISFVSGRDMNSEEVKSVGKGREEENAILEATTVCSNVTND